MRVLRLFRLARMLRMVVEFRTLWMLVRGLIGASSTILYTALLILLILYIFACLAVEMITQNPLTSSDEAFRVIVDQYWCDIPTIMLTLVAFVFQDSAAGIYAPM